MFNSYLFFILLFNVSLLLQKNTYFIVKNSAYTSTFDIYIFIYIYKILIFIFKRISDQVEKRKLVSMFHNFFEEKMMDCPILNTKEKLNFLKSLSTIAFAKVLKKDEWCCILWLKATILC